mmetsp:Transcript_29426/g.66633  ORF Transcript_29426/g.66633 Transcript_29426/m.66633 type:complete len:165 (-) Transcript_29426:83-577(-)|eukprot:768700-Hanusia_phi.AAC.5
MEHETPAKMVPSEISAERKQSDCYIVCNEKEEEAEVDVKYPKNNVPFEISNIELGMPPPRMYRRTESSSSLRSLFKERDFASRDWRTSMVRSSSERCLSSSGSFVRSRCKFGGLPSWQEMEVRKKHNMMVGMEISQSDEARLPARMMLLDLRRSNSEPCLVALD